MSQLHTTSRKVIIKYVGPVAIYKIIDPHNYLLMKLKPANIRTNQGNVQNLAQLKQVVNEGLKFWKMKIMFNSFQEIELKYAFAHKENTHICT